MNTPAGFKKWLNSDNVHKVSDNLYTTQCAQWANRLTMPQLIAYYKREYTN